MSSDRAISQRESIQPRDDRSEGGRNRFTVASAKLFSLAKAVVCVSLISFCVTFGICCLIPMQIQSRFAFAAVASVQVPVMTLIAVGVLLTLDRYRLLVWTRRLRRQLKLNRCLADDELCSSLSECDPRTAVEIRRMVAAYLGVDAYQLRPEDNLATLSDELVAIQIWIMVNDAFFADDFIAQYAPYQPWIALTLESLIRSVDFKQRVLDCGPMRRIDIERIMMHESSTPMTYVEFASLVEKLSERKDRDLQELLDASTGCLPNDFYGRVAVGLLSVFFLSLVLMFGVGLISSMDKMPSFQTFGRIQEVRLASVLLLLSSIAFTAALAATCSMGIVWACAAPRCLIKPMNVVAPFTMLSLLAMIGLFVVNLVC